MDKKFTKKDFEPLKRLRLYGRMCEGVDATLYWVSCMDSEDAVFSQTIRTHHHDFFEIHFVLSGNIVYSFNNVRQVVSSPAFLIIPDGVSHTIESYSSDMLKLSVAVKISGDEPLSAALTEKGCVAVSVDRDTAEYVTFCIETAQKRSPYKETLIKNRTFELLCLIAGECDGGVAKQYNDGATESDVRLFKAKQFIKDNPSVFVGCKELAQYCNISPKQLNRIFLKYEGIPLLKYIHSEKLERAKGELLKGRTLSEISDSLGFSSVYYFSKFFTDREGITPGAFKKANAK